MKKALKILFPLILICCAAAFGFSQQSAPASTAVSLDAIPPFAGEPYVILNDNIPNFDTDDWSTVSFETYSPLDMWGRCGVAYANVGLDLMPTEERGSIGSVKPSGWHLVKYDIVDGKYLYNRCHLIGYQLSGENANEQNLVTGTRYLNVTGMLPFENEVGDYVRETGNHVLYRVTPVFQGDDLVASGVQMEAMSVEDGGAGICFNVYAYNCQPGITIDYATGESWLTEEGVPLVEDHDLETWDSPAEDGGNQQEMPVSSESGENTGNGEEHTYVLNHNSMKFHNPSCSGAASMKTENRETYTGSREDLIARGYTPCGQCRP